MFLIRYAVAVVTCLVKVIIIKRLTKFTQLFNTATFLSPTDEYRVVVLIH